MWNTLTYADLGEGLNPAPVGWRSCKLTRIITSTYNHTTKRSCNWPCALCVYLAQAHKYVAEYNRVIL